VEQVVGRIRPGLVGEVEAEVTEGMLAPGGRRVLSTPSMIGLMEGASTRAVDHLLPEGWLTVGYLVNVRHLAAAPLGSRVRARAELIEADGRRLVFRVEAWEGDKKLGEGVHERRIVELRRFLERAGGQ
jgi:fluoroacetyl-CoA thioesterase